MSEQDWTHAFDGLTVEGDDGGHMDLGEFLRSDLIDELSEAVFKAIAERITELSKAALDAGSGWTGGPVDTGVAAPDVQFVAVPVPVEGRINVVYGPFTDGGEAIQAARGLSSDPEECYVVPVIAWQS